MALRSESVMKACTGSHQRLGFVLAVCIVVVFGIQQASAGCSRFGHSCFGAHGKRAEVPAASDWVPSAADLPPFPVYQPKAELFAGPGSEGRRKFNPARLSPYFLEWAMAAQRGSDVRQSKEDDTRRK